MKIIDKDMKDIYDGLLINQIEYLIEWIMEKFIHGHIISYTNK